VYVGVGVADISSVNWSLVLQPIHSINLIFKFRSMFLCDFFSGSQCMYLHVALTSCLIERVCVEVLKRVVCKIISVFNSIEFCEASQNI